MCGLLMAGMGRGVLPLRNILLPWSILPRQGILPLRSLSLRFAARISRSRFRWSRMAVHGFPLRLRRRLAKQFQQHPRRFLLQRHLLFVCLSASVLNGHVRLLLSAILISWQGISGCVSPTSLFLFLYKRPSTSNSPPAAGIPGLCAVCRAPSSCPRRRVPQAQARFLPASPLRSSAHR